METRRLKACLYLRVSTSKRSVHDSPDKIVFEQSLDLQEQALRGLVSSRGWELVKVFSDRQSGAKEDRPGLLSMLEAARRREFDCLVIFRLDRLARSLKQLVALLDELRELKITFISHQEALETETSAGRMLFGMIAVFSEFERSIIRERVVAGVEHARVHGTKSGRPLGRPRRVFDRARALEMRRAGVSISGIAREMGLGKGTVARVVA